MTGLLWLYLILGGQLQVQDHTTPKGFRVENLPSTEHRFRPSLVRVRALLIGVSEYQNQAEFDRLNGVAEDIRGVHSFLVGLLKQKGLNPKDRIKVIQNASLDQVRTGFQWLQESSREDDLLLIVWSGHGWVSKTQVPFLVTHETTRANEASALPFRELLSIFNSQDLSSHYRLMVVDTCHSGYMQEELDLDYALKRVVKRRMKNNGDERIIITAARGTQSAAERNSGGFFISGLLNGLKGMAALSTKPETLQLYQVYSYAEQETRCQSDAFQQPSISGGGLDFPLITLENPCENLFRFVKPQGQTHRSNVNLEVVVSVEPNTLERLLMKDLKLIWRIDEGREHQTSLRLEGDVYKAVLDRKWLHHGILHYRVHLESKKPCLEAPFKLCEKRLRLKQ